MARSFYRPREETAVEDFSRGYYHRASKRHYRMHRDGDRYLFERYQIAPDGKRIHVVEQQVDWVLGSGNHSRTYLYRTDGGELYQLPLAWYSQEGIWRMAPGFDRADHEGVGRRVRRECMFCHNAYPDVPAGSDAYREPPLFPEELPEGIGCQRCHGPGALHAGLALDPDTDWQLLRSAIVNPGRLEPRLRDDVCYGCHMQPSVAISGVRRFGRGDYSFRPGQALDHYQIQLDVREAGESPEDRFEINHHPYRLEQSPCYLESEGRLSCLSCHDPHEKVPAVDRAAHYRAACQTCHAPESLASISLGEEGGSHGGAELDCVSCHMPERRPRDVVQVTMTDHRIQVPRPEANLTAALSENNDPDIVDVVPLDTGLTGEEWQIYRAATIARLGKVSGASVDRLDGLLHAEPPPGLADEPGPWLDLAAGLLHHRRTDRLGQALDTLDRIAPESSLLAHWRAVEGSLAGDPIRALEAAREAVRRSPRRAEAHLNLGLFLFRAEKHAEAEAALLEALRIRPTSRRAWHYLARIQYLSERRKDALASLERVLALDPTDEQATVDIAWLLDELGRVDEARRYLDHALTVVADREPIEHVLGLLGGG